MNLLNKDFDNIKDRELKQQLKIEAEQQFRSLKKDNLQRLEKIGYTRPRTRLQVLYADKYMTDKQFANILALEQVVKKHPELNDDYIHKFIIKHRARLIFLNHVLKVVPNAVRIIRLEGANSVVYRYARALEHIKDNRRKL